MVATRFVRADARTGTSAEISSRAASLRRLVARGRDLVEPTSSPADPPGVAGAYRRAGLDEDVADVLESPTH
ncbi:hypothetical protein G3T36_05435 [Diaminobutyricibacter tongyongensis]|uniref:Uncharacterized protein n=1 Tax=Leifsonia tongyongensis TaxID=1268043 RepID=A0A6L9XWB8_9MICO|nr:hypothetical protein [Diaminobutyricibacter tongyongensis]NEN05308.1 hypothetical protein [Diaminobutyricibacter tongyongensis]